MCEASYHPTVLHQLRIYWDTSKHPDRLALWAAATLCFAGFFRSGELLATPDAQGCLNWGDVSVDNLENPMVLQVHLRFSKCDQFGGGVNMYMGRAKSLLCPVAAVVAFMTARGTVPGVFFLTQEQKLLNKSQFVAEMKKALTACGINQAAYSGHSFWIGAATAAAQAGLPDSTIQMLGQWNSAAFLSYIVKRLEAMDCPSLATIPPNLCPTPREIPSLLTWAYCFAQYVAVLADSHPHLVKHRLAYMCLLIHEGRKNGGRGWADYDTLFRQHAAAAEQDASDTPPDWSRVEPSLHASCLVGARDSDGQLCVLCSGSDHTAHSCALNTLPKQVQTGQQPPPLPTTPSRVKAHTTSSTFPICIQWNKGECRQEDCRYCHTCATCPGQHRAMDCPATQRDSFYKRAAGQSSSAPSRDRQTRPQGTDPQ